MGRKIDRQIEIFNTLVPGRRIQCQTLAYDFGVSVKTIKQDILELSFYYPIDTYRGRGGGIQLRKGYSINGYIIKKRYLDLIAAALKLYKQFNPDTEIDYILAMVTKY